MDVELLASTLAILIREAAPQLREWGGQATAAAAYGSPSTSEEICRFLRAQRFPALPGDSSEMS